MISKTDQRLSFRGGLPSRGGVLRCLAALVRTNFVLLLPVGATLLSAQIHSGGEFSRTRAFASRKQVEACVIPSDEPRQAEEGLGDAADAELLCRTLNKKDLTKEESADLEAAALRRLERRKAIVEKLRRLVDTSSFPLRGLDASMNEVDSSAKDYVLAVMRTTLVPDRLGVADADSLDGGATAPFRGGPAIERFDGDGSFTREDCHRILLAYEKQFNKSLPVSAHGDTALHRALGYNHRNRMDVALFPDAVEGVWLRRYLKANDISYYAFRGYVPGKATAAHIHVGPPSSRLLRTN